MTISGNALFALSRSTVDVDTDGNGTADLLGATLDQLALSVQAGTTVAVTGVATLTLQGNLALAQGDAFGSGGDGTLHGAEDGRRVGERIGRQRLDLREQSGHADDQLAGLQQCGGGL